MAQRPENTKILMNKLSINPCQINFPNAEECVWSMYHAIGLGIL